MKQLKANIVQQLRGILRGHYDSASIIKELLQNADDAGSKQFHIAWTDNWPTKTHPLLSSPAILILNDGEFRPIDAKAISHLGEGSKGDDNTTIGKYGLGMKSVFHLCEGFFYAASKNQPASKGSPKVDLITPWPEKDGPHDDWSDQDNAEKTILERLDRWNHGCDRWFSIVIPLRREEQLAGAEAIIQGNFPDVKNFIDEISVFKVAQMVPLSRSLKSITIWNWNQEDSNFLKVKTLELKFEEDKRCSFPKIEEDSEKPISASFTSTGEKIQETANKTLVVGLERRLLDIDFQELKNDPRWPKNITINPNTGRSEDKNEKAVPHCAAVFVQLPNSNVDRSLCIDYAVFLPLAERQFKEIKLSAPHSVQLLLHGHFFLDEGRKNVLLEENTDQKIETEWNKRLLEKGLLPLIPKALNDFVAKTSLKLKEICELTEALLNTDLLKNKNYSSHICSQNQWICRLHYSNDFEEKYELLKADSSFYEIPEPREGGIELIHTVFPNITNLSQKVFITFKDRPRLKAKESEFWATDAEKLTQLLESIPVEVFTDTGRLSYLTQFIETEQSRSPIPEQHIRILIHKAAQAITDSGMNLIRKAEPAWKQFLTVIGTQHWVRLGQTPQNMESVFRQINGVGIGCLVIPHDIASDAGEGGQLNIEDTRRLFQMMAEIEELSKERKSTFAHRILEKTSGTHEEQIRKLGDFQVFLIRKAIEKDKLLSWNDLQTLYNDERLFSPGPLLAPLQRALGNIDVFSLSAPETSKPFQTLFNTIQQRSCDRATCVDFLNNRLPDLATPESRIDLLQRLLGLNLERDDIKAIRYLLHGVRDHASDIQMTLRAKQVGPNYASPFSRLAREALRQQNKEWCWIPDVLCEHLNDNQKRNLSVVPVDPHHVTQLLNEMPLQWVSNVDWTDEERMTLLQEIRDEELWKRLPLHRTTRNELVSLNSVKCYLENPDFPISPVFLEIVTLISLPGEDLLEKYLRHIKNWTPEAALRVSLSQVNPESFALAIMDALSQYHDQFSYDILEDLRNIKWLPTSLGPKPPKEILDLPHVEDELRRLLAEPELEGSYCCALQIDMNIQKHPGFKLLRQDQNQILANCDESIDLLGLCLGVCEEYRVGNIDAIQEITENLWMIVDAFEGAATDPLRVLPLLRGVRAGYCNHENQGSNVAIKIAPGLLKPIRSIETIRACLNELANRHQDAHGEQKEKCLQVFDWYLKLLTLTDNLQIENLKGLKLFSQQGRWKLPESLCVDCEGVHPDYLLDEDQAKILRSILQHSHTNQQTEDNIEHEKIFDGKEIVIYFRSWEGLVPCQMLGGFLAFFGDDEEILTQADAWLAPHSVKVVREWLNWEPHERDDGLPIVGQNEDIHDRMIRQRFRFRYGGNEGKVRVRNLLGKWFEAQVDSEFNTIFLGNLSFRECPEVVEGTLRFITLRIRKFDPHTKSPSPQVLREILRESSRLLIQRVYGIKPNNLDNLWKKLGKTGQLPLRIAQDQILQGSWFYLPLLVSKELNTLREILQRRERLNDRRTELQDTDNVRNQKMIEQVENDIKKIDEEFRNQIQDDEEIQNTILRAVRRKVEEFGYDADTIPFELFQNADDAAAELADMGVDMRSRDRLAIQIENNVFRLIHWGRPINEFCRDKFNPEEGRKRGYNTDLKKMLILSASDKSQREGIVTGKYGLGFKTVFLVSNRPKIISADLAFEIVGGFYPRLLSKDDAQRLKEILEKFRQEKDGTVIELDLSEETGRFSDGCGKFFRTVPCLLAFSRKIKELELPEGLMRWSENPIDESTGLFVGRISHSSTDGFDRAIMIRGHSNRAVLLPLGPEGFCPATEDMPTFWATAPVSTDSGAGIAVNADFEVDVGRRQLANSEKNRQIASEMGEILGKELITLFEKANSDWEGLRVQLGLAADTTPEKLWRSLWDITTAKGVLNSDLLKHLVWHSGRGMAQLVMGNPVLPTALATPYNNLTSLKQIQSIVKGALDRDEEIFKQISSWSKFQEAYPVNTLISEKRIANTINNCGLSFPNQPKIIDLKIVLKNEFDQLLDEIDPETAARFGEVINSDNLKGLETDSSETRKEAEDLREILSKLCFKTRSEHFAIASDLISAHQKGDESLRTAFAPDDRVLSDEYSGKALKFFLACRKQLQARTDTLTEWGLEHHHALTREQRNAFLRYLLEGDLRNEVARIIRDQKNGTWLQGIPLEFQEFDQSEKVMLHGILRTGVLDNHVGPIDIIRPEPPIDPHKILERIYEWWEEEHQKKLDEYEKKIYPDGQFPNIDPGPLVNNSEKRKAWLKLFLLGMSQTIGWASPQKNSAFLRQCEHNGLFDAFAKAHCNSRDWLETWYRYVDQQINEIQYYQWMKQFGGLYIIARNLNEYVNAFLAVENLGQEFPIEGITNSRTSSFFQGGGPDAPPASGILGIGQCFVMRELVRNDVIHNKRTFPWCYVPRERVRKVIKEIGGPDLESIVQNRWYRSRAIYNFLQEHLEDKATFLNSFDIPFLVISENRELQEDFLGRTIPVVTEDED